MKVIIKGYGRGAYTISGMKLLCAIEGVSIKEALGAVSGLADGEWITLDFGEDEAESQRVYRQFEEWGFIVEHAE